MRQLIIEIDWEEKHLRSKHCKKSIHSIPLKSYNVFIMSYILYMHTCNPGTLPLATAPQTYRDEKFTPGIYV